MKTIFEMQAEHEALNPGYTGSPVAPLPTYPEREDKPWDSWGPQAQEAELRRGIGDELFEWLEENC